MLLLPCFCHAFAHVCILMHCGHLVGEGRPLVASGSEVVTFPLVSWVRCSIVWMSDL